MNPSDGTVAATGGMEERLLRRQAALAAFGRFALRESDVGRILTEGCRLCAEGTETPYAKVLEYRADEAILVINAGWGWTYDVRGARALANESNPTGLAIVTGAPVPVEDVVARFGDQLPEIYFRHRIRSSVNVLIKTEEDGSYGVLEVDTPEPRRFGEADINFLTTFANVLGDALVRARDAAALRDALAAKEALVHQQTVLLREMQHRVRNHLQLMQALSQRHAQATRDETARRGFDDIARRVMALAALYDHLLGVDMGRTVDLAGYLRALLDAIAGFASAEDRHIRLAFAGVPVMLPLDSATALGILVNELVANSLEHAFPERSGGEINVTLEKEGGMARLVVRDDGAGVASEAAAGTGLVLVRRLVTQVGGTLQQGGAGKGASWTVTFPA